MSNISLKNISLTIFGESHGECVGGVLTGFPAGFKINYSKVDNDMNRRKPGNKLTSHRNENDEYKFISGILNGITTGAPICVIIPNADKKSSDYDEIKDVPRPSHADYTAYIKYSGYNDVRGGGHFSGRLTAPMVALGSLCKQYLETNGISVKACIESVGGTSTNIENIIEEAMLNGDSVGGKVLCQATGFPKGIGGPIFEGLEGELSKLFFGIPGVKAVEFGLGFKFSESYGCKANDLYRCNDGIISTITNNNGGVVGGISNGNSIDAHITFKPTPSIYKSQQSVNIKTKENVDLTIRGRYDPCIAIRGVPVTESIMAIGLIDKII